MANSYTTVDPMTLEAFYAEAEQDGFVVNREEYWIVADEGEPNERGCFSVSEEIGMDDETYVGCMRDPHISTVEMIQSEEHETCGTEATSDPDEEP